MKRLFTIVFLLMSLGMSAQTYNNEWIDFSKTYYKFKVGATGLYRIPQSVLAAAGLGNTPVQYFQLFRNGQEVPLYTTNPSGVMGSGDYVEFWGRINDGAPDVPLYRQPAYQHTQKWSLETDTAVYFLTVNPTGNAFHYNNTANNPGGSSLQPEPYFLAKAGRAFKNSINPGYAQVVGEYIYSSSYDIGEFWASNFISPGAGNQQYDTLTNLYVYPGGPDASIKYGMVGCADNTRTVSFTVNGYPVVNNSEMDSFYDLTSPAGGTTVPLSSITNNNLYTQFVNNCSNVTDRIVASYYEMTYPRQFNFGGQSTFYFELPARGSGYLLNITNFNVTGAATPVLYDMTNGLRYTAVVGSGNTVSFALQGSTAEMKLALVNEDPSIVNTVSSLTQKNFTNFASGAVQGNYLIISNPALYIGSSGNNPVADYKAYRSSAAGGAYNVQIYDINELVDQFGFGIKKHPLSIQNFLRYARATFSQKLQYVFLIGHGMTYSDYNYYSETNHDPLADKLNLIPTFGYPASDNKLSANNGVDAVPVTPIGRLSVVTGPEIEAYTSKVKEYEQTQATSPNTLSGRLWMKNLLQLTGASEPFLGTILCNYMTAYQQILADTSSGFNVTTFCDGNAGGVSQVSGNVIPALFATGFSVLNYFGHSSNTTLDYNLNNPQDYNNTGKYPVFYVNGCDAGDFFVYDPYRFSTSMTLSESWVLAKEKGAIAFVASTHFGIVNYLNILLYNLCNGINKTDYGKSIGIIQKDALQLLVNSSPGDFYARLHAEEMTTHGDPALVLNQESLPDYDIDPSQVRINPLVVSIADNSFSVNCHFYNLGKAVPDSISILVTRKFPDGSTATLIKKRIPGIRYQDSLLLNVPIVATRDKGQNYITVTVNSDNNVQEVTTANNSVTTSVFIYEDEASPVYPYNYAIINTNTSKVYASTSNPFSPTQQYIMQMDTTKLFNSSALISKYVTSAGGVIEFDPGISFQDSMVYYWRVSIVPATGGVYKWNGVSFVYIDPNTSKTGMNQSHFYQHTESNLNGMLLDTASRSWRFTKITNNLYARGGVFPEAAPDAQDISVAINGNNNLQQSVCYTGEIIFYVYDAVTFSPWYNAPTGSPGRFGSVSPCGPTREYQFIYNLLDPTSRKAAVSFMDQIPAGDYVIVGNCSGDYQASNTYASDWAADTSFLGHGNSLYARLQGQGFYNIDSFNRPRAFIFAYQKNMQSSFTPSSVFSNGISDKITLSVNCLTPDSVGYVTSPTFGPAKAWRQLHWRGSSLETPSTDNVSLQLIGIDTSGNPTPLYNLNLSNQDYDISSVSASQYPFMQLKLTSRDTINGTPYQLKYWRLNYDPVPEGAIAPNVYLVAQDTMQIGQPYNFAVAFKNISPTPFDSVTVKMNVIDQSNVTHVIQLPKKKPLVSGDTLTVNYTLDTKNYTGNNTMYVNVNPNYAQPEQYLFNNFLYKSFYVAAEGRNPLMDVTFDNVHILNDDIVSSRPHIQIKLKSQSQYLLLTDTSLIKVQLRYPDGSIHSYNYSTDTLRFTPATSGTNNTATVDFTPSFNSQVNASGDEYQLIVTGKDNSSNTAGTIPYRIGFKIITKSMISNMLNYPNPFTTSTAFVFTITGSEVPQNIKIQILTITGKIVREITKEELGPLHVGRNITEFKWNGTDMYGQRLATGVYLYHVVTNLNGKSLDKYTQTGDNTDQYFNNGYGKMYLMK